MGFDGFCGVEENPEKVENVWANFKVTPMASNLQVIFFRPIEKDTTNGTASTPGADQILVKFMMNGHDVLLPIESAKAPFYTWTAAREFLKSQADKATATIVRAGEK